MGLVCVGAVHVGEVSINGRRHALECFVAFQTDCRTLPRLGDLGLYKCNGYKPVHRGGQVYAITATFQQTFHP